MNAIEPNENRGPTRVFVEPQEVRVEGLPTGSVTFGLVSEAGAARLVPRSIPQGELVEAVAAAAEALTASDRTPQRLAISCADAQARACLVAAGLGHDEGEDLVLSPEILWQRPEGWLVQRASPYPQSMVVTAERRHPRRPPKPTGPVYRRAIPWLSATLTFRAIDATTDPKRAAAAARFAAAASSGFAVLYGAVVVWFSEPIAALFTPDPAVRPLAARALVLAHLAFPLLGLRTVFLALLQAMGRAGQAAVLGLASDGYLLVAALAVLPARMGFDGVLASLPVSAGGATLLAAFFALRLSGATRRPEPLSRPAAAPSPKLAEPIP